MTPAEQAAADVLAEWWPALVPDDFVAWDPESTQAQRYRRSVAADVIEVLAGHEFTITAEPLDPTERSRARQRLTEIRGQLGGAS